MVLTSTAGEFRPLCGVNFIQLLAKLTPTLKRLRSSLFDAAFGLAYANGTYGIAHFLNDCFSVWSEFGHFHFLSLFKSYLLLIRWMPAFSKSVAGRSQTQYSLSFFRRTRP